MRFVSLNDDRASLPLTNIKSISVAKPSSILDSSTRAEISCLLETITEFPPDRGDSKIGVAAIQSYSPIVTRVLRLLGNSLLSKIGPANNWRGNEIFDQMLIDAGAPSDGEELADFKKTNMHVMSVGIYENTNKSLVQNNKIPHKFNFSLDTENPPHLAYFTLCFLEDSSVKQPKTPVKNDIVFENRIMSTTSYYYQMPDGNYWSGPVTKTGSTYMAENAARTKLRVRKAPNAKILDFRKVKEIAQVEVMQDFENEKKKEKDKTRKPEIRKLDPSLSSPHPYVSDMFPAYDFSRNVRFSFMVNFEDLVFNNSDFGKLWRTQYEDLKAEIINSATIEKIKIWRQPVKSVPNGSGYIDEKDSIPTLVADSSQKRGKKTIMSSLSITEQTGIAAPKNIRTFDVTDLTIDDSSRSCYRYWAEINVRDGTKEFFRTRTTALRAFHSTLKDYSAEISKNKLTAQDIRQKPEGYNPEYDRLTDNFADRMRSKYWSRIREGKKDYLKTISLFQYPEESIGAIDTNNFMTNLLDPGTTSLDKIDLAMKMVDDLILKIISVVGDLSQSSSTAPSNAAGSASSKISQTLTVKNFKTLIDFKKHDLGGYEYIVGTDSFEESSSTVGLKKYSGQAFLNRLQKETLKYFVNAAPNMDLGKASRNKKTTRSRKSDTIPPRGNSYRPNLYSYLSPSRITYGNPKVSFTSIDTTQDQSEEVLRLVENKLRANLVSYEKTGFPVAEDERFKKLIQDLQSDNPRVATDYVQNFILQSVGVSAPSKVVPISNKKISFETENSDDLDRPVPVAAEEPNNQSSAGVMPASLSQFISVGKKRTKKQYVNYGKKRSSKNVVQKMSQNEIGSLPNQLSAFFLTNSDDPQDVKLTNNSELDLLNDSRYSSTSLFNYRLITTIEYLSGFDKSTDGMLMMTAPRWQRLTPENYASLVGKNVLCRLVKYSDNLVATELDMWPEEMDMRIYNQYFYIRPDSPAGTLTSQPAEINREILFPSPDVPDNPFIRNLESGTTSLDKVIPAVRQRSALRKLSELETLEKKIKGSRTVSEKGAKEAYRTTILSLKDKANRGILMKSDIKKVDKFRPRLSKDSADIRKFADTRKSLEALANDDAPNTIIQQSREQQPSREAPERTQEKTTTRRTRRRTRKGSR